jgi:hypothetical protein
MWDPRDRGDLKTESEANEQVQEIMLRLEEVVVR